MEYRFYTGSGDYLGSVEGQELPGLQIGDVIDASFPGRPNEAWEVIGVSSQDGGSHVVALAAFSPSPAQATDGLNRYTLSGNETEGDSSFTRMDEPASD